MDGFGVWGGDALSNRDLWIFTIRKIAGSIGSQTFSRKWGYDKNLMIEALDPWISLDDVEFSGGQNDGHFWQPFLQG